MTVTTYCAVCREEVYREDEHVVIQTRRAGPVENTKAAEYLAHLECATAITAGWREPA